MWNYQFLTRIDFRVIPVILALMIMSLVVISSFSTAQGADAGFLTPTVKNQMQWFGCGWVFFFICAGFDYNKLREWTWFLYATVLLLLTGLFFASSIAGVNRWYRIPILHFSVQPSELAKLVVIITLSWYLERRRSHADTWTTVLGAGCIMGIPFFLILKQPDLGTAIVLCPMTLVMLYFGDIKPAVVRSMTFVGATVIILVAFIFMGVISHEDLRPLATKVLKSYQFNRLDPNTHHQKASATAIAIGGIMGTGWGKSEYTAQGWLPAAYTDSVFPAFGEEFGLVGLLLLLTLLYALIYFSFQVSALAKDYFGRLLSAGIAVYLAMHILLNIGMMVGFFPITGVPLILITYGGSSTLLTMSALGILQSIYSRRFMF